MNNFTAAILFATHVVA